MKQTIYVDVLVSVNLIADYFLLYASAVICGRRKRRARLLLAAVVGATGSLLLLLPPLPAVVNLLVSLILSSLMTLAAFGRSSIKSFLLTGFVLYSLSAAYSGTALLIWLISPEKGVTVGNGAVYLDIDPTMLVLTTVVLYTVLSLLSGRISAGNIRRTKCTVTVSRAGKSISIEGIVDTGCSLTEPFSGLPVIIAPGEKLSAVMPPGMSGFLLGNSEGNAGIRAVPYRSAGGGGMLAAFMPDSIEIEAGGRKYGNVKAYIAAAPDESISGRAIVNPDAVEG